MKKQDETGIIPLKINLLVRAESRKKHWIMAVPDGIIEIYEIHEGGHADETMAGYCGRIYKVLENP